MAANTAQMFRESGAVARELGISVTRVHQLTAESGLAVPRTSAGRRLYDPEAVEALRHFREQRQAAREATTRPRAA